MEFCRMPEVCPHDHQPGAGDQCRQDFFQRHIETQRGELEYGIAGVQFIVSLNIPAVACNRVMGNENSLGLARRSRRVDDISQVLRASCVAGVAFAFAGDGLPARIHTDDFGLQLGESRHQPLAGQQNRRFSILEHEGQALSRIRRFQGYICAAGLENAQQPDDRLQ